MGDKMVDEKRHPEGEALAGLKAALKAESSDGRRLLEDPANNPVCLVGYDADVPCVTVVWKGYATSRQLRFVHEEALHLLALHKAHKMLGDDTELATIHSDDQKWIVENWLPRAIGAGLRACASKRPTSYFGRLAVDNVSAAANSGVMRAFDDIAEARGWLKSCES
jgi:hypothetical protein